MRSGYYRCLASAAIGGLLMLASPIRAADSENKLEHFDPANFSRSTVIDNEWFPIKPGMRYVWDGFAVDEEGDEEPHSVAFVVTDLVKEIAGVRTVVCWDRDFVDGELEEAEIMFLAQDNEGSVWLLGEYPEEYDNKDFVEAACWIHGVKDGHAGIIIKKDPKVGMTHSQGWAPTVEYTDRALVYKTGEKVTVPVGTFEDVVVIDESNNEVEGAHHLKYYARGVGVVYIGWRGRKTDQEEMKLIKMEQLSADEMAKARDAALTLEKHAYEIDDEVFSKTQPIETVSQLGGEE